MKMLITIPYVLAAAAAGAQTINQSQVRHVETSLNHITVIEFGEPVTTLAIADADSFAPRLYPKMHSYLRSTCASST